MANSSNFTPFSPNQLNQVHRKPYKFRTDLQSEYDPINQYQKNQWLVKKTKKVTQLNMQLTIEEGTILLERWKRDNFCDFNNWIQLAKGQMTTDINEITNPINRKAQKSYTCNITLLFEDDPRTVIGSGFGKSKKDAKKMAVEKVVIELIQNGLIAKGLKNKDFLDEQIPAQNAEQANPLFADSPKNAIDKEQEEGIQKIVHKLSKKMQEYLKKDRFVEAIEVLCHIIAQKHPDWNEISFIWCYSLLKKNTYYLKTILEVIQKKSNLIGTSSDQGQDPSEELKEPKDELERKVTEQLKKKYGSLILNKDNPYDILDAYNLEMNLPEIENLREITDEEANAQIVKDIDQDLTKALHQEELPDDFIKTFQPSQTLQKQNSREEEKIEEIIDSKPVNLDLEEGENMPLLANTEIRSNSRDQKKQRGLNHVPYLLLDEFYDSALYVPDMKFALSVTELLYNKTKIDPFDFTNENAAFYYANKKNMMTTEMIESMYQIFAKSRAGSDNLVSISGRIERTGSKYVHEVLIFTPEAYEDMEGKISRKGITDNREGYYQIGEGEIVLLSLSSDNQLLYHLQGKKALQTKPLPSYPIFAGGSNPEETLTDESIGSGMIACVREVSKDFKVKLFVLPNQLQTTILQQRDKIWKLTKLSNRTTIDRTSEALQVFCTKKTMNPELYSIILATPSADKQHIQALSQRVVIEREPIQTNLNVSQQKALRASARQLLTLIQGPPGTGKTTTAVEIIIEWLRHSSSQILACADSNIAVDILHSELQKANIKTIRIGPGYDDKNDLKRDKNYKVYTAYVQSKQYHYANNVRYGMMKRLLNECSVVCATCVGSTSEFLKGMNFTRVIMDEATQATEMTTLIPIIRNCQQLVLIGDHKQLPPTVLSSLAQSKGMTISLFERLVKQGIKPNLLNIQYRMHPSIAAFPSKHFYDNMLENGVSSEHRPIIGGFVWPNPSIRVCFINVKGTEQLYSSSIMNPKEIEVVVELLLQILRSAQLGINNIGIITPYDAQKRKIRNEVILQAKKFPNLFGLTSEQAHSIKYHIFGDIDTVDGYQVINDEIAKIRGWKRNQLFIVLFALMTLQNPDQLFIKQKSLGFLRDPRRLNVTLTRAKRGLIVIGNFETLMNDPNWLHWILWCRDNKILLNYEL